MAFHHIVVIVQALLQHHNYHTNTKPSVAFNHSAVIVQVYILRLHYVNFLYSTVALCVKLEWYIRKIHLGIGTVIA